MKIGLLTFFIFLITTSAWAQSFDVIGTVSNSKYEPLQSASVFIDGSKKITLTNEKGEFTFRNIPNGTHQLVIKMLGYQLNISEIIISGNPLKVNKILEEKEYFLPEVTIYSTNQKKRFLDLFKKFFLGESANAKSCEILNADILNFNYGKDILTVSCDEFLILKNHNLGYQVKYLLEDFTYNSIKETTSYKGECIFEELEGSDSQKLSWHKNRRTAYLGSMMHYLRFLSMNNTKAEGFLTYKVLNRYLPIEIRVSPINTKTIVDHIDSNFFRVNYPLRLYIIYDINKAKQNYSFKKKDRVIRNLEEYGSIFKSDGYVDHHGNLSDYKNLLIQGNWGRRRIGDQLPTEYDPVDLRRN
jgi:hypothetical protein